MSPTFSSTSYRFRLQIRTQKVLRSRRTSLYCLSRLTPIPSLICGISSIYNLVKKPSAFPPRPSTSINIRISSIRTTSRYCIRTRSSSIYCFLRYLKVIRCLFKYKTLLLNRPLFKFFLLKLTCLYYWCLRTNKRNVNRYKKNIQILF